MGAPSGLADYRGPRDHIDGRILQTKFSGIPRVSGTGPFEGRLRPGIEAPIWNAQLPVGLCMRAMRSL